MQTLLNVTKLLRKLKTEPELRSVVVIEDQSQTDRLLLNFGRKNVVFSEYGSPALDHLSTLTQFHLLSPWVLRSQSLLRSIPPLRK
jgi:hypothetical protein